MNELYNSEPWPYRPDRWELRMRQRLSVDCSNLAFLKLTRFNRQVKRVLKKEMRMISHRGYY